MVDKLFQECNALYFSLTARTAEELYKMSREHLGVLGTKEVQKNKSSTKNKSKTKS